MKKHKPLIAITILVLVLGVSCIFSKTSEAPVTASVVSRSFKSPSPSPLPHTDFREISKIQTQKKIAVITVDAGFGDKSANGLLLALKKHKIKASFFLVGQWVEKYPEITKRIVADGHEIFNHSYSHPDYTTLTPTQIKADLEKMDNVLYKLVGLHTRPYYRAPSGARNAAVNQAAAEAGYQHIYWSLDPQDWRLDISGETIKSRVLTKLHPGAIILLHIADSTTGDVADEMFTEMEARGYKLVSFTEALGLEL